MPHYWTVQELEAKLEEAEQEIAKLQRELRDANGYIRELEIETGSRSNR